MQCKIRHPHQMEENNYATTKSLRRQISRSESKEIYDESILARNNYNHKLTLDRNERQRLAQSRRKKRSYKSQVKMKNSPFLVDLVAEQERIDEENMVLLRKQMRQQNYIQQKQACAKNDLILRALQEDNELEALRREKRQILEEEKRLKALLEIEKVNGHRKQDRLAAERAERQRRATKLEYRRLRNKELLDEHDEMKREILRIKHEVLSSSIDSLPFQRT